MAKESLFTAAQRFLRDFNIDMAHGGLIKPSTEHSAGILALEIEKARPAWLEQVKLEEDAEARNLGLAQCNSTKTT
jgi:hypothetical protein